MKNFEIIILPCSTGHQSGYIARWQRFQTWGKSRAEVIRDMLAIIEKTK